MKPPLFNYLTPSSLAEAVALMKDNPGAMILAGGQSLIPALNFKLASPTALVDIRGIPGLDKIEFAGDQLVVGSRVRHAEIEHHEEVGRLHPILPEAIAYVAHAPIRNRGTVVGSLCHGDAAAEMPLVLVLCDGWVTAIGPGGNRKIQARDFFRFHMTTSREPEEIITSAHFPLPATGSGYSFVEFARRSGNYAIAAIGTLMMLDGDGKISDVKIAGCGIANCPIKLDDIEKLLIGSDLTRQDLAKAKATLDDHVTAPDDLHATNEYRRFLAGRLLSRSLRKAKARATNGGAT